MLHINVAHKTFQENVDTLQFKVGFQCKNTRTWKPWSLSPAEQKQIIIPP